MARPGDRAGARRDVLGAMAARVPDLGRRELPPEMAQRTRAHVETQLGMRCGGCGKRIGVGFQFTRIDVVIGEGGAPSGDVLRLSACNGADGCEFADSARENADVVEMVEFVWLQGDAAVGRGSLEEDVEQARRVANGDRASRAAAGD